MRAFFRIKRIKGRRPPYPPPRFARTEAGPRRGGSWVAHVAMAGLAFVVTGAATFGLWTANASTSAGVITAGEFGLELVGVTWESTGTAETGDASTLGGIVIEPGDTLVVRAELSGTFSGDNLAVELGVAFENPITGGIEATWRLLAADDAQVAPAQGGAPLGDRLTTAGLAIAQGMPTTWYAVVDLTNTANEPWHVDPTQPVSEVADLGMLTITANQVRWGTEFEQP